MYQFWPLLLKVFAGVFVVFYVVGLLWPRFYFRPRVGSLCVSCDRIYSKRCKVCAICGSALEDPRNYKWIRY